MAMLRVRCERCKEWIATGTRMDTQAWTRDDVDRSVFGAAG